MCSCDPILRTCRPQPLAAGTPCGEDDDYYFGQCNEGPGSCVEIESPHGNWGVCVGVPRTGMPCNDADQCTVDDKCQAFPDVNGLVYGQCIGTFAGEDVLCTPLGNSCTINGR
jgi:hypothetical protein